MFDILLISPFSSWFFSNLSFSFSLTLMSPDIPISIMAQLLSFLFTTTISGFLALISVKLDHNIPQHLHFFISNNTFWSMFIPFFTRIFNELFLQHYHAFSCIPFGPTFCIHSQYNILFHFSCHTFYKVVIGLFYLSRVSYSLFELLVLGQHTTWLMFQLSSQLFSASAMFLFHLLFLAFLLQAVHILFFRSSFFSLTHLCFNSFFGTSLYSISLYSIISAAFTPLING